ncbi:MAG: MFS transporter [bacterium]
MMIESRKPGHGVYRWIVFLLLAAGYVLVNFHRLCPAVVALDLMRDLQAGGSLVGILASAYFYPYAFMQIPSGLLADSWGPRKTITSFFLLAGIASIGFGLAPTAGAAIGARVLVGIGVSMYFVPVMKILTRWFTVAEFSFMTGWMIAAGGLGALTAATPLACLSAAFGWRGCFILIGAVTLATAGAIWILVRNHPAELGYSAPTATSLPPGQPEVDMGLWRAIHSVATSFRFWPLALWYFFNFGIFYSFGGLWGGPFLMEIHQLSKPRAGAILSMMALGMMIGSPICGYLSDHVLRSRKKVLVLAAFCTFLLSLALWYLGGRFTVFWLYMWCFLLGLFSCSAAVVGFAAVKESFPVRITGTAMGLVNVFPFLGGALMQPAVGLILDWYGKNPAGYPLAAYRSAFGLYLLSALFALVSTCFVHETFPAAPAKSQETGAKDQGSTGS